MLSPLAAVPVALRQRPELAGVVGDLLNTLVLRTRLDGPLRFTDLLSQVRADMLAAHTHGAVPFDAVVAAVAPARTPGRNPLFDVMLNYAEDMDSALALPGLAVERLAPPDLPLVLPDEGALNPKAVELFREMVMQGEICT